MNISYRTATTTFIAYSFCRHFSQPHWCLNVFNWSLYIHSIISSQLFKHTAKRWILITYQFTIHQFDQQNRYLNGTKFIPSSTFKLFEHTVKRRIIAMSTLKFSFTIHWDNGIIWNSRQQRGALRIPRFLVYPPECRENRKYQENQAN